MSLDSEARITGLIRLLTIGLRVLTLLEFGARRQLHDEGQQLAGLYAGNPTRISHNLSPSRSVFSPLP